MTWNQLQQIRRAMHMTSITNVIFRFNLAEKRAEMHVELKDYRFNQNMYDARHLYKECAVPYISTLHTVEHPSPVITLESSHSSPDSSTALPHTCATSKPSSTDKIAVALAGSQQYACTPRMYNPAPDDASNEADDPSSMSLQSCSTRDGSLLRAT